MPQDPYASDLRRNAGVLIFHGLLGTTGFRLIQAPTFLPTYIGILAGNNTAVGIARAVQSLGMLLSPVISASMIERRTHTKRLTLLFGALMRLQILLLALIALFAPAWLALSTVWLVLATWGLASGLQAVAFNVLLAKAIPVASRGWLTGLRNLAAGLTLLLVSAVAGTVLDLHGYPRGYGYAFLIAFALTSLGLMGLLLFREPAAGETRAPIPLGQRVREIPALLTEDKSFRVFVWARMLGNVARGVLPFYVIAIGQLFGVSGRRLAAFTIAYTIAQSGSALAWGLLGDRRGYRLVFLSALGCWILGSALIVLMPSVTTAYLVFALVATGVSGTLMAGQNLVLEFGRERDRAMRIAATNSVSEASGMIGFLLAGAIAELVSLQWLFVGSALLQAIVMLLLLRVQDPRHRRL